MVGGRHAQNDFYNWTAGVECEHEPGAHYGLKLCHYFYDGLDRVLEGSFVYRGAEPGTGILSEISDLKKAIRSWVWNWELMIMSPNRSHRVRW